MLQQKLADNHQQFFSSLDLIHKPILPIIPSSPSPSPSSSSINDLLTMIKTISKKATKHSSEKGEKDEEYDWFPYPQLYPPGRIFHIRNNPNSTLLDDDFILNEISNRLKGVNLKDPKEYSESVELVHVDKKEFDHYSLEASLMEDHRMGNYAWGLIREFDCSVYNVCSIVRKMAATAFWPP